jgi:hypothetical protein
MTAEGPSGMKIADGATIHVLLCFTAKTPTTTAAAA